MATKKLNEIDEYIKGFPVKTQKHLKQMRSTIKKAAPLAEEHFSYRMPAYKYLGVLVYFAGYNHHIGFYPGTKVISAFQKEITKYKNAKGSVQFPLDQPLPTTLITKMTKFRAKENLAKSEAKKIKSK